MLKIYITDNENIYGKVEALAGRRGNGRAEIFRTRNGKPYIGGDPLFFSVTHSGAAALIALCDKPVGIDAETVGDRKYPAVLSRFCAEEKREIAGAEDFLKHWVVREAYVKMLGATLAEKLKALEFTGGILYDGGVAVKNCGYAVKRFENIIYCVCADGVTQTEILNAQITGT